MVEIQKGWSLKNVGILKNEVGCDSGKSGKIKWRSLTLSLTLGNLLTAQFPLVHTIFDGYPSEDEGRTLLLETGEHEGVRPIYYLVNIVLIYEARVSSVNVAKVVPKLFV